MVLGVRGFSSSLLRNALRSVSERWARRTLPMAVQWAGRGYPTRSERRTGLLPSILLMTMTSPCSKTARCEVSPVSAAISASRGEDRLASWISVHADAARWKTFEPIRYSRVDGSWLRYPRLLRVRMR